VKVINLNNDKSRINRLKGITLEQTILTHQKVKNRGIIKKKEEPNDGVWMRSEERPNVKERLPEYKWKNT